MRILGIDPGATSGWCIYDSERRAVDSFYTFPEHHLPEILPAFDYVVVERPKGYGPTRPQLVDCGYVAGRIVERLARVSPQHDVCELTRLEVCRALTDAVHGAVRVRNDATAWAALVLLHGEGSGRKPRVRKGVVLEQGGALGGVSAHCRAALAVAVAFALRMGALVA